jgi:hypothetical protein
LEELKRVKNRIDISQNWNKDNRAMKGISFCVAYKNLFNSVAQPALGKN